MDENRGDALDRVRDEIEQEKAIAEPPSPAWMPEPMPAPGSNILIVMAKGGRPDPENAPLPGGVIGMATGGRVQVDVWAWSREHGQPRSFLHVSACKDGDLGWDWMPYQKGEAQKPGDSFARLAKAPAPHHPADIDSWLKNRFTYHAPKPGQTEQYEAIRGKALELADLIVKTCPNGEEKMRALGHLDDAVFNANAAIARHG